MQHNRHLVILKGTVVAVVEGPDFAQSGYTGEFLVDYDTIVQDNEGKLDLGSSYIYEEFSPASPVEESFRSQENYRMSTQEEP